MTLTFEMFATASAGPDDLWAVVGDPTRLPEWTDVDSVEASASPSEGDEVTLILDGDAHRWTVVNAGNRILELQGPSPAGKLGLGARVVPDPRGSRLVLACTLDPSGNRLWARLVTLPRLRTRCDRWTAEALRLANGAA